MRPPASSQPPSGLLPRNLCPGVHDRRPPLPSPQRPPSAPAATSDPTAPRPSQPPPSPPPPSQPPPSQLSLRPSYPSVPATPADPASPLFQPSSLPRPLSRPAAAGRPARPARQEHPPPVIYRQGASRFVRLATSCRKNRHIPLPATPNLWLICIGTYA